MDETPDVNRFNAETLEELHTMSARLQQLLREVGEDDELRWKPLEAARVALEVVMGKEEEQREWVVLVDGDETDVLGPLPPEGPHMYRLAAHMANLVSCLCPRRLEDIAGALADAIHATAKEEETATA